MKPASGAPLSPADRDALRIAVDQLEHPHLAARLADYAGQPINTLIKVLPGGLNQRLHNLVQAAVVKCLEVAIDSLDHEPAGTSDWMDKLMVGVAGGVGGFFGLAALPVELPITTALMLRSIAEIARASGEDLSLLETRLACLEVFALGARGPHDKAGIGYYATRVLLARLASDLAIAISQRGAVGASTPVFAKLVGEIVARFGLVVSDLSTASAVPVFGALGGATVNVIFTDHFQRVARGHFTVRRLERVYGEATVRGAYERIGRLPATGGAASPAAPTSPA
jgi:hypothetical protein